MDFQNQASEGQRFKINFSYLGSHPPDLTFLVCSGPLQSLYLIYAKTIAAVVVQVMREMKPPSPAGAVGWLKMTPGDGYDLLGEDVCIADATSLPQPLPDAFPSVLCLGGGYESSFVEIRCDCPAGDALAPGSSGSGGVGHILRVSSSKRARSIHGAKRPVIDAQSSKHCRISSPHIKDG
jgi:hypothetical protein